jgi:Anti-sigma-K factor rskA
VTGHEAYEELAAGHALDALEPEDEQRFLRHLAGCALCERELALHRDTAAQLAYGAGQVDVPEGLAARLRAAVAAESGVHVFAGGGSAPVSLAAARTRRRSRLAVLASAAAAVLVVGLVGSNVALRQDRVQQTASSDRLAEAVATLGEPGRNVPLLDDAQHVAAVAVVQDDSVSLVVEGLAANDPGTTYVLWERGRFGGVQALATFDVRGEGVQVMRDMPLQHGVDGAAAFAITHEKGERAPERPLVAPLASGTVEDA